MTQTLMARYGASYEEVKMWWPGPATVEDDEEQEWAGFADMAPDKLRILLEE